jgi:uncharacterized protein YjiS (DUF1127 family)
MIAAHGLASQPSTDGTRLLGGPRLAGGRLTSPLRIWRVWRSRSRYRTELRRLLRLGAYLIDDVGLGLGEAVEEARKPFWRA